MQCPSCAAPLLMTERQGVEIDYCGECRGVWLDRGELDKIIERSAVALPAAGQRAPLPVPPEHKGGGDTNNYRDDRKYENKKHKGSFLGELFDF